MKRRGFIKGLLASIAAAPVVADSIVNAPDSVMTAHEVMPRAKAVYRSETAKLMAESMGRRNNEMSSDFLKAFDDAVRTQYESKSMLSKYVVRR